MSEGPYHPEYVEAEDADYLEVTSSAKNWAMLCHLAALVTLGAPTLAHIIAPLIVWLLKRDEHPFIDEHGKESVNFQISITIYTIFAALAACFLIGIPILIGLWIANIVLIIMAAVKASSGQIYHYPLTIRLIN